MLAGVRRDGYRTGGPMPATSAARRGGWTTAIASEPAEHASAPLAHV
jgi:hypothetical protein